MCIRFCFTGYMKLFITPPSIFVFHRVSSVHQILFHWLYKTFITLSSIFVFHRVSSVHQILFHWLYETVHYTSVYFRVSQAKQSASDSVTLAM